MGQKVSPHGLRVGIIKDWSSTWYANKQDYSNNLVEDYKIREYLKKTLKPAGIDSINIARKGNKVLVDINTAKPGMIIGKNGADIEIDTGLKVKRLLDNSQGIEVTPQSDKAEYKDGAKLDVKITAPAQSAYSVDTVTFAGKELSEGSDYTYTDGVITVNKTDNTGIGKYTVLFTDTEYENVTASFILNSAYANEEAQIEENALVLPEGVDTSAYVKNISSVSVNGKVVNNAVATHSHCH